MLEENKGLMSLLFEEQPGPWQDSYQFGPVSFDLVLPALRKDMPGIIREANPRPTRLRTFLDLDLPQSVGVNFNGTFNRNSNVLDALRFHGKLLSMHLCLEEQGVYSPLDIRYLTRSDVGRLDNVLDYMQTTMNKNPECVERIRVHIDDRTQSYQHGPSPAGGPGFRLTFTRDATELVWKPSVIKRYVPAMS